MLSLGNWKYANDLVDINIFDQDQNLADVVDLPISGLRVSDAAQTTAALGMLYKFWDKTSITVDYNYFADIYAQFDVLDRAVFKDEGDPVAQSKGDTWKAPNYHTFDASLRHGFKVGNFDTTLTVRVNNLFDTEYIADALDAADSFGNPEPLVWFGFGRTFNLGMKILF